MSKNLVRKGADGQPREKISRAFLSHPRIAAFRAFLDRHPLISTLLALLALAVFSYLAMSELTGNQSPLFMLPQVEQHYGHSTSLLISNASNWSVSIMLILVSIGLGSRVTGMMSLLGFIIMGMGYLFIGIFHPAGAVALVTFIVIGASSIVIAFVRAYAERVKTGLPVAPNQIVGGMVTIESQYGAPIVAYSALNYGLFTTCIFLAVMLGLACILGLALFLLYKDKDKDARPTGKISWKQTARNAWTPRAMRAASVNYLNAAVIGCILGTLVTRFHRFGLDPAQWSWYWAYGATGAGLFMIFVFSRIAQGLRDRGLFLSAGITLAGALIAFAESNMHTGVGVLAGGLVIALGANTFESALYGLKPTSAEALAMNSGRALGFTTGAQIGLLLVADGRNTWAAFAFAVAGMVLTFVMRRHWDQEIEHPLTARSLAVWVSLLVGAGVCVAEIVIGGLLIALILAGVVLIGALIVGVRYIINRIAAIEIRLNRAEARATLAETRLNLTWKRARRTEARLHRVQGELARTRNIVGLPSVEAVVQGVRAQLNTDLHEIGDRFEERFSDLEMILDGAEVLITAPVPTAEGLLGAGDNLKLVKSQIESLRKSFIGDRGAVSQRLEPGFVTLAVLDQRLLHNWLMLHRARMWKAASTTRQRFDTDLTSLLERLGILEAQRVEAMRTLRESLRTQNTVDNRSVRERRKDITALKEELGED